MPGAYPPLSARGQCRLGAGSSMPDCRLADLPIFFPRADLLPPGRSPVERLVPFPSGWNIATARTPVHLRAKRYGRARRAMLQNGCIRCHLRSPGCLWGRRKAMFPPSMYPTGLSQMPAEGAPSRIVASRSSSAPRQHHAGGGERQGPTVSRQACPTQQMQQRNMQERQILPSGVAMLSLSMRYLSTRRVVPSNSAARV